MPEFVRRRAAQTSHREKGKGEPCEAVGQGLPCQSSTAPPVELITLEVIMRALSDATKATARAMS